MAATDARPVPIKNTAFRYYFSIRKNDGTLITSWTGADSEVSLDGAVFSDCTNEATEIGTSGCGYIDLTSSEMNADSVFLKITVTNTSALTTTVVFFPQEAGDIKTDVETIKTQTITCAASVTVYAHVGTSAASTAQTGDGYAIVSSGTHGNAALKTLIDTLDDFVDTEVAAIKAKTDNIPASPAATGDIPSAATIADAVWDEAITGHLSVGTTAATLADASAEIHLTYADLDDGGRIDLLIDGIKAKTDNLPAAPAATGDIPGVAAIADGVWDEVLSGHLTGGTTGAGLNAAGSAGDPWGTALPGAYTAGSAGYILGTNLNATVSSRSSHSAADVWGVGTRTLSAFGFTVTTNDASNITAILADTNELQTDWADGGRLDAILDARASQTSVDDVPTNAELAAALANADDATLAAIAALSIPTTTQIADAVLTRNMSNVESSAGEHTLCTIVLAGLESSVSGTTWTIKRTDGTTTHATKTVAVDAAADPITGVS